MWILKITSILNIIYKRKSRANCASLFNSKCHFELLQEMSCNLIRQRASTGNVMQCDYRMILLEMSCNLIREREVLNQMKS